VLVLEVDGSFHMDVEHWENDIARQRGITDPHRVVVRCTAREVRDEQDRLGSDLRRLGVPGRESERAS
jgi:very-short-patch-repair endonuclease